MKNLLLLILILIPISLLALFPSFKLGLYGDDWLVIWRYLYTFGPESHGFLNHVTHFLSRYGSFEFIMAFLAWVVGYKSIFFYATAYVFRLIGAISFYPVVFYITKDKLASFIAVIFFSVTVVGLDATNWVFNMPVYIAIAALNFFFLFYIRSLLENRRDLFWRSLIFFIIAIILASVRMIGLIPLVLLVESFWIFQKRNLKAAKKSILRFLTVISCFMVMILAGQFLADYGGRTGFEMLGRIDRVLDIWENGISTSGNLLGQGKNDFILYPLVIIGNIIVPIDVDSSNNFIFLIIAGVFLIFSFLCIITTLKKPLISTGLFLSIAWMVSSFFFAWLQDPRVLLPFPHRYLIVSVAGLSIFIGIVISLTKKLKRSLLLTLFCTLLLLNIFSTRKYLQNQVDNLHGSELTEKIWSQMPYISRVGKTDKPLIFYFKGENRQILYGSVTFGFPVHMALLYNIDNFLKMPNPVESIEQVISAVTDGKSLAPFGLREEPIPVENIYAFKLEGRDNLVNITEEIRKEVTEKLLNK